MAENGSSEILRPSVLDRLMKREGDKSERMYFDGIGLRELKQAVARDLAWLLNTRMWISSDSQEIGDLEEVHSSVLTYGIPDLSIFSWANPQDCKRIAGIVEQTIRTFEPRLLARTVKCEILPTSDVSDFSVKLRIEAVLQVDPISEHVAFDSVADFEGGGIRIESFE
jgi:type VI secretion system protein ImpF